MIEIKIVNDQVTDASKKDNGLIKGYSFGFFGGRGDYTSESTMDSLRKLRATGTEWIALCMVVMQEKYNSTEIKLDYNKTATDLEVIQIVQEAHKMGFKVCMKPMINCEDNVWRARITFPDEGDYWQKWFHNYGGFLKHYAEIAEMTGCELFCLGCEMIGTEHKEDYWRPLIGEIKSVYNGPLTYNANHGKEEGIAWWDLVDYLGTSAYYPVAQAGGASEAEMIGNWEIVKAEMAALHHKYQKPILFMEIGCRSARGCATMPWDFSMLEFPHDEDEQARFYNSCMTVFHEVPWFKGYFWWDWSHNLHSLEAAPTDDGFGIYGKKAEQVLKEWYQK